MSWQTNQQQLIKVVDNWPYYNNGQMILISLIGDVWRSASCLSSPDNNLDDYVLAHPHIHQIIKNVCEQYQLNPVYIATSKLDKRIIDKLWTTDFCPGPIILSNKIDLNIISQAYPISINKIHQLNNISLPQVLPKVPDYPHIAMIVGPDNCQKSKLVKELLQITNYQVLVVKDNIQRQEMSDIAEHNLMKVPAQSTLIVGRNPANSDRQPFINLGIKHNRPTQIYWIISNQCLTDNYQQWSYFNYTPRFNNPMLTKDANTHLVYLKNTNC